MLASELIKSLQELMQDNGDIPCFDENDAEVIGVSHYNDDDDGSVYVIETE